jgi:hypothetical protein
MSGIPHTVMLADLGANPKGKIPYIKHGGKLIGDTELIIRYLENSFDVKAMAAKAKSAYTGATAFVPFDDLSPSDQAISDLVRLTCESELYWALVSIRWLGAVGISASEENWYTAARNYFGDLPLALRLVFVPMIRANVAKDARYGVILVLYFNAKVVLHVSSACPLLACCIYYLVSIPYSPRLLLISYRSRHSCSSSYCIYCRSYGLARHSPKDQLYLAKRAVKALSTILGHKPFFLGSFPTECDCAAFGVLQNIYLEKETWPNPLADYIHTECPNLADYVHRLFNIYFPECDPKTWTEKIPSGKPEGALILKADKKSN